MLIGTCLIAVVELQDLPFIFFLISSQIMTQILSDNLNLKSLP